MAPSACRGHRDVTERSARFVGAGASCGEPIVLRLVNKPA